MLKKLSSLFLAALLVISFAGCASQNTATKSNAVTNSSSNKSNAVTSDSTNKSNDDASGKLPDVEVRFGINGKTFTLHLNDNDTAAELARNIGEAGRNLPIYHYNDFENYKVMQYYDIPSSYSIPSHPETVTSEKAGEVYYSAPNRVILFYQDAEIKGKFTKVGNFENSDGLKAAVENNAVIEGWGNKIISVNYKK